MKKKWSNCSNCNIKINSWCKYCSRGCYFNHRYTRTHPEIKCSLCSKIFRRGRTLIKELNYCSKHCSAGVNQSKYVMTQEHRNKMSVIAKNNGYGKWMLGRKGNNGTFKKGQFSKEKHPFWKGGITPINQTIRVSDEYKEWRLSVFTRDNYRCQWCGIRGGKIQADHIFPFSQHKNKRFLLSNGRTLCSGCHKKRTATQLKIMWKNQTTNSKYLHTHLSK